MALSSPHWLNLSMTSLVTRMLWCLAIATQLSGSYASSSDENEGENEVKPCPENQSVCTSLFRITNQDPIEEGPYCTCSRCKKPKWDTEDRFSLTWFHHERTDWTVQYKFCERLVPRQGECKKTDENVALIRVNADSWNPKLIDIRCTCPSGMYYLRGWKATQKRQFWEYTYSCHMDTCSVDDACVRRFLDRSRTHTTGYKFLCSCPEGQTCPVLRGTVQAYEEALDEEGMPYANSFCQAPEAVGKSHTVNDSEHGKAQGSERVKPEL